MSRPVSCARVLRAAGLPSCSAYDSALQADSLAGVRAILVNGEKRGRIDGRSCARRLQILTTPTMINSMSEPGYLLSIYLHLAAASLRRHRPHVRDRMLIIAGTIAARMELDPVAANCRHLVLEHNPNHLIRRWVTMREAIGDDEFLCVLKQLQRRYPQEKAERMLQTLGVEMGNERAAYYSELEYAAALMGTTPEQLLQQFGE